jgi:hypothetical protein
MSKHEQMLEASIHYWVLKEEKRAHEPVGCEVRCTANEKPRERAPAEKK